MFTLRCRQAFWIAKYDPFLHIIGRSLHMKVTDLFESIDKEFKVTKLNYSVGEEVQSNLRTSNKW